MRAEASDRTLEAGEEEIGSGMKRGGRHAIEQLRGDTQHKGVHHDRRYRRIKIDTDRAGIDTPTDARLNA